jgi:hypothetical protein
MILCSDEECAICSLLGGSAGCLRKQAERYMRLSKEAISRGSRYAFEELSLILMDEANAVEKEMAIPSVL